MSKGFLLDTNIAIAILINEEKVLSFAHQASRDRMPLYFSAITECEVFAGLKEDERVRAEKLFAPKRCVPVTSAVARLAGTIRKEQRNKGRKLKTPDALIIATAMVHGLTLISRDADMQFVQQEFGIPRVNL